VSEAGLAPGENVPKPEGVPEPAPRTASRDAGLDHEYLSTLDVGGMHDYAR
jgi:hypothetical protein